MVAVAVTYDKDIALNAYHAWVAKNDTIRGFFTGTYKSFNYANESGLRRQFKRDFPHLFKSPKKQYTAKKNDTVSSEGNHISEDNTYTSPLSNHNWIIKYCGYSWDRIYLEIMRELIWNSNKLLVLLPRGHGKTLSMIGLFCRWILEIGTPVLVFCSGSNQADIFYEVKTILESEEVIQDYGERIERTNATKGEIRLKNEYRRHTSIDPDFKVVGQLGKAIGKHSGWIHLEDVVQDTKVSEDAEKNVYRWLDRVVKFMKKRTTMTKFTLTGTRKAVEDFYWYASTKHHIKQHHEKALTLLEGKYPSETDVITDHDMEEVELIDPTIGKYDYLDCPEWQLPSLLYDYIYHYEAFEAEMQNNPLPDLGLYFSNWDDLLVDDLELSMVYGNCYIAVDPAFGKTTSADYFALVIGAIHDKELYIVKTELKKGMTFDQQIKMIRFYADYLNPINILVETNFHQVWMAQEVDKYVKGMIGVKQTAQKEMRIDALDIPFTQRKIRICRGMGYLDLAYQQFVSYDRKPSTTTKKDDWLDAVATLYEHTKNYLRAGGLYVKTWTSKR